MRDRSVDSALFAIAAACLPAAEPVQEEAVQEEVVQLDVAVDPPRSWRQEEAVEVVEPLRGLPVLVPGRIRSVSQAAVVVHVVAP